MANAPLQQMPRSQQAIALLWPSFVTAVVATGVFFSAFNPIDLMPFNLDIDIGPLAMYSVGFLSFWLLAFISSFGTLYFTIVNSRDLHKQGNGRHQRRITWPNNRNKPASLPCTRRTRRFIRARYPDTSLG